MQNVLDNNYIKNTPDFVYIPPKPLDLNNMNNKSTYEIYISKFKTAIYGALLFTILSLPSAYKILDIIAKLFSNNIEIIGDECDEPNPLGRAIMAILIAVLLFIL
jgi:hypothetical protein